MQKVLIFGVGNMYKEKEEYIRKKFEIVGFLDNKVKDTVDEYQVCSPQKIEQYLTENVQVLLMSYQYVSMWKQLQRLGVDGRKILFGVMIPPYPEMEQILYEEGRYLTIDNDNVVYFINPDEKVIIQDHMQMKEIAKRLMREKFRKNYPMINTIAQMDAQPASREFGLERGSSVDRYYIEQFLEKNKEFIHGDCIEIAENTYTLRYGENRVKSAYMLHVCGWGKDTITGNLETGEGIEECKYDCAIITQTLMCIYDIRKVVENIYKMLKKGGHALLTVSGISQVSRYDADRWGFYYGFHKGAMEKLFVPVFGNANVKVQTYGNVKIAMALLYGLCQEDLAAEDFEIVDEDYPVIISVILHKV